MRANAGNMMGEMDSDTIGLIVLIVAIAAFFIASTTSRPKPTAPS
jgi:hypothetical protein